MIITAVDPRLNTAIAFDVTQLKMLVEALRTLTTEQYICASQSLQRDGFHMVLATDVLGACMSFCSVAGAWTDQVRYKRPSEDIPAETIQQEAQQPNPQEEQGEDSESPPTKTYLN